MSFYLWESSKKFGVLLLLKISKTTSHLRQLKINGVIFQEESHTIAEAEPI